MTKARIALIALAICCIAMLSAGTMAYFTVQGTAYNVITTGILDMTLVEKTTDGKAPEVAPDDYENLPLFPEGEEKGVFGVMPSETVSKIPYVENTGTADFYTRIRLDIQILAEDGETELPLTVGGEAMLTLDIDTQNWSEQDGWYYCNASVAPEEATEPLFTGVTFAPEMGNEYQNATVTIEVDAQAVQSRNNGASALEAAGWPADSAAEVPEDTTPDDATAAE